MNTFSFLKNIARLSLFIAMFFYGTILANAALISSTAGGGYWSSTSSWVGGVIPTASDSVEINGGIMMNQGASVINLTIHGSGSLSNPNVNGTLTVNGDLSNDGNIDLHSTSSAYNQVYGWQTTHYYVNLKVNGNIENNGNITDSRVYIEQGLNNTGAFTASLTTTGTGNIAINGDISGSVVHSSEGTLSLGGHLASLNLQHNTEIRGVLNIGNLYLNGYELDLNGTTVNQIGELHGTGKIYDSGNIISELNINKISTINNAELLFDTINTHQINGSFISNDLVFMNGGTISGGEATIGQLILSGAINSYGLTLNGNLKLNASSSLSNPNVNGTLTVNGDLSNDGSINLHSTSSAYNQVYGWQTTHYYVNLIVNGNIENNGTVSGNSRVYLKWSPIDGYTDYILSFSTGEEINRSNSIYYNIPVSRLSEQNLTWKVKGDGILFDSDWTEPRCINGCGVVIIEVPTGLAQEIQSPLLDKQPVALGEQIGKFQSGTGMILSATIPADTRLTIDIYESGNGVLKHVAYGGYNTSGASMTWTVTVSYSNLGSGDYYWKARTEDEFQNTSDGVEFGGNATGETDFALFEGFEPYPYGYKFPNASPADGVLTGGVNWQNLFSSSGSSTERFIEPGYKWDIFNKAFYTTSLEHDTRLLVDAFESVGLNQDTALQGGNCYGMAVSSAMQYSHPDFLQTYLPQFSSQIGTNTIWNGIESPSWSTYSDTLETIFTFQLAQDSVHQTEAKQNGISSTGAILTELENNSDKTYVLNFWGVSEEEPVGHAVIPYKVQNTGDGGYRIYIWDNNYQYPIRGEELAYNQYIEVFSNGNWEAPLYDDWTDFTKMSLVNIDEIFHSGSTSMPRGFNGTDIGYTLSGSSDLYVSDSLGRVSGFQNGLVIEEIPGVDIIVPLNATLSGAIENTWKQIYLPIKQGLTIHVKAGSTESYDLMIAGGDYYTRVAGVETSSGQIDSFIPTRTNLEIDFDDSKTGDYDLLIDDFYNSGTGTVFIDSIVSIPEAQQYLIDWTRVVGSLDSVNYGIDTDGDGSYDSSTLLPAVFQDIEAPTAIHSFTGTPTANTTDSYIETVTIDLTATDNQGGSGVDTVYYSLDNTASGAIYIPYTEAVIVNGVGDYTLSYYSVDLFGNIEPVQTQAFSLTELPETYAGNISGYVYEDDNENGVQDSGEKTMAGWTVFIDQNGDNEIQHQSEPFVVTNNDGYYEFSSLVTGNYHVQEVPHQNWIVTHPVSGYYDISLQNGQVITNQDFGNYKTKGNNK